MPDPGSPAAVSSLGVAPERLVRRATPVRAPGPARTAQAVAPAIRLVRALPRQAGRKLEVVRGRRAILALAEPLRELARRSGQTGDADDLAYFLTVPDALKKTPWLIAERALDGTLHSAVLVFEYRFGWLGSGVFAVSDARRSVMALPAEREETAARAARRLMEDGASMVHLAFSRTHHDVESEHSAQHSTQHAEQHGEEPGEAVRRLFCPPAADASAARREQGRWALEEHDIRSYLPLAGSFDETLKRIGQRTRSNLRYYRRRAEAELGSEFVPQVQISREDFIAFDRRCRYAVGDARAGWRFDSLARLRTPFLAGIRATSGVHAGQWLGLVGGRRQSGSAEIDWQMNREDLPASSLSTVLRAYLIEHMVSLGMKRLYIEGGTPQPIGLSFAAERVAELTVVRASAYARLLHRAGPALAPKKNYLAQVLQRPELEWQSW